MSAEASYARQSNLALEGESLDAVRPPDKDTRPEQSSEEASYDDGSEESASFVLLELPGPALQKMLECLPALTLMATSAACKQLAEAAEPVFQAACQRHRWKRARMPRGHAAQSIFPWRSLHSKHACISCHAPGDFPLREPHGARVTTMLALVCAKCVWKPPVKQRLVLKNLSVDLVSLKGTRLLPHDKKRKR
ncbi:hypothetical protein WJX73_000598 [Symbiochloris irregularis]|uniref:F-box domain-containing protein n=1 Tax=Symbiochloris irregularis TaxID=706552 RepID=A0AAW1P476_9CHLO